MYRIKSSVYHCRNNSQQKYRIKSSVYHCNNNSQQNVSYDTTVYNDIKFVSQQGNNSANKCIIEMVCCDDLLAICDLNVLIFIDLDNYQKYFAKFHTYDNIILSNQTTHFSFVGLLSWQRATWFPLMFGPFYPKDFALLYHIDLVSTLSGDKACKIDFM